MRKKEVRACPACNKSNTVFLGVKQGFDIYRCLFCSSLFTDRIPDAEESQDYNGYYDDPLNVTIPAFIRSRVAEIIGEFEQFRDANRMLDIGFGAGTILDAATEKGWDVHGLEVSEGAVRRAKEAGYNVFHGSLKEASYPDRYFDVISASEILEHLPDPESDLAEIARILRPGGLLWATTPSAMSLSFRIMGVSWSMLAPPEHTQLYSKKGAKLLLSKAGFDDISFKAHGFNIAEVIRHFNSRATVGKGLGTAPAGSLLNQHFSQSPGRRFVKGFLNDTLSILGLGDTLKIYARSRR